MAEIQPHSSPLPAGGRPTFEQSENGGWGDWKQPPYGLQIKGLIVPDESDSPEREDLNNHSDSSEARIQREKALAEYRAGQGPKRSDTSKP